MFPGLGADRRRGITVLTLLLIIIAVIVAAIFLVRYLQNRPAVSYALPSITASIA
jgi:flagellar biogenesis protein FliO